MNKKLKSTAYSISQYLKPTSRNHGEHIRETASWSEANTPRLVRNELLADSLTCSESVREFGQIIIGQVAMWFSSRFVNIDFSIIIFC